MIIGAKRIISNTTKNTSVGSVMGKYWAICNILLRKVTQKNVKPNVCRGVKCDLSVHESCSFATRKDFFAFLPLYLFAFHKYVLTLQYNIC